jgi:hypothetical protein
MFSFSSLPFIFTAFTVSISLGNFSFILTAKIAIKKTIDNKKINIYCSFILPILKIKNLNLPSYA